MKSTLILLATVFLAMSCQKASPQIDSTPNEISNSKVLPTAILALDIKSLLGEGAFWHEPSQTFYWVDIVGQKLNIFNPSTGKNTSYETPSMIGTVVPSVESGKAVIALMDGVYLFDLTSQEFNLLAPIESDLTSTRLNDGKCDPYGRLWVGGMHLPQTQPESSLYWVDHTGKSEKAYEGVTISNGLVWSADHRKFYYIDTPTGHIKGFDYDIETGKISNEEIAVTIPETLGSPDGMTIDAEGKLWVGLWNGNCVARFDPNSGKVLATIPVPAHNVTSCAFGGPNLDTLYITTSSFDMTEEEEQKYPQAGAVFKAVPGVKGVLMPLFGSSMTFSNNIQNSK